MLHGGHVNLSRLSAELHIMVENVRESLAFGCRTSQLTRLELLEQRESSGHAVQDARALNVHVVALALCVPA